MNITDDVWFEVCLHLPLSAIFKFKCVSKVWFSTLSSPNFIQKWYKLNDLSLPWALVQLASPVLEDNSPDNDELIRKFTIPHPDSYSEFVAHHHNGFSLRFLNPNFTNCNDLKKSLFIIGSSNGLVLCCISLSNHEKTYIRNRISYYVCNPLTQKWVSLPRPPTRPNDWITNVLTCFMCNDECFSSSSLFSTSYKVIRIPEFAAPAKEFKVEILSPDLGEWKIYGVSCPEYVTWNFLPINDNLVTHNGVLYWLQKLKSNILVVNMNGNNNHGYKGRLINLPVSDGGTYSDLKFRHRLGESEGFICYAIAKEKEKSLSVWVLEDDWCLLYKDEEFNDVLAEMGETLLIGGAGKTDLITQLRILGFSPVDKNVVILGYDKYVWAYNTTTKAYEQLRHPSFLRANIPDLPPSLLTFSLRPRPTVLPQIVWRGTSNLGCSDIN